jgi:hypothetical protein
MKSKTFLVLMLIMLLLTACSFPFLKKVPTPMPTPTPDLSMQLYQGNGMSIYLPPSYIAEDIKTQLPNIIETITNLIGSGNSTAKDLLDDLENNVAWYGYDGGTPAVYPTRLVVIKNKTLVNTPVSLLTFALERFISGENITVNSDTLTVNGREMTRFTYSKEGNAWVAYIFKAEGQLWLSVFITTPANLAVSLEDYNSSIGSMIIDPVPAE